MVKIGLMQGRACPEHIEKLQVFPKKSWLEETALIKEIGFDYFEVLMDSEGDYFNYITKMKNHDLLNKAKPFKAYSACMDNLTRHSLLKDTESCLKLLKRNIDSIVDTSVEVAVLPFYNQNHLASAVDIQKAINIIKSSAYYDNLKNYNIKIAIEADMPANEAISILDNEDRLFTWCYDLGNVCAAGREPEKEILELGSYIGIVHLKDRKIDGPNVLLGQGNVNFTGCFEALNTIGYDGLITLETAYFKNPLKETKQHYNYVRKLARQLI